MQLSLQLFIPALLALLQVVSMAEPEHPNRYALVELTIARRHSKVSRDANLSLGTITIELFADTPETSFNFAKLATSALINNPFHRIISGFMMQGGDFTAENGTGGMSYKNWKLGTNGRMRDENFKHKHSSPYMLSMANSGPNTNGSQFFITFAQTPWLDGKHVVFGRVVKGEKVIDEINQIVQEAEKKAKKSNESPNWGYIFIQDATLSYESKAFKDADSLFEKELASKDTKKEL